MIKLRPYQKESVQKARVSLIKGNHPLIVMPTGTGKSIVLCGIIANYLTDNITKDVLVLSHRKKILEQDFHALIDYFHDYEIGLYSAGLDSFDVRKITVAGIHSIYKKADLFNNVGLVIIDECHLINHDDNGMYRMFLRELDCQYLGLTATHFRLGHGYIHEGENTIFNDLAYDLSSTENYNKLIEDGYLSPMYSKDTRLKINIEGVKLQAGDFKKKDLSQKVDREAITDVACHEIVEQAKIHKRTKWLIFAIDVEHAHHIHKKMISLGIKSAIIHHKTDGADAILSAFEYGTYDCIINVEILTTGLDIPSIDLIAILRPTQSPSLHVQMLGRGGRPVYKKGLPLKTAKQRRKAIKKGKKKFCLILDFGGNIERLGPINNVTVNQKRKKLNGKGEAITKVCPSCKMRDHISVKVCSNCGHEFEFKEKIHTQSSTAQVIQQKPEPKEEKLPATWYAVNNVSYKIHQKPGSPSSFCVIYKCGMKTFREYICIDHGGFARHRAKVWIQKHMNENERKPRNLSELYKVKGDLKVPYFIKVERENGWDRVKDYDFNKGRLNY